LKQKEIRFYRFGLPLSSYFLIREASGYLDFLFFIFFSSFKKKPF